MPGSDCDFHQVKNHKRGKNKLMNDDKVMKKSIRLVGSTLLVTGLAVGGSALAAGAASADTGQGSLTVAGNTWSNGHSNNDHKDNWGNWKDKRDSKKDDSDREKSKSHNDRKDSDRWDRRVAAGFAHRRRCC